MARGTASERGIALSESASTGEEDSVERDDAKVILIPRASLVSAGTTETDLDLENPMHRQEFRPIAVVVENPSSEMVQNGNTDAPRKDKRRRIFRWLVLLALLLIAAALISLVVEVTKSKKREREHDGRFPSRRPPPDMYPNVDGNDFPKYEGDGTPFTTDGTNNQMDRNNTWVDGNG
jgi:hypothetical protein